MSQYGFLAVVTATARVCPGVGCGRDIKPGETCYVDLRNGEMVYCRECGEVLRFERKRAEVRAKRLAEG